MAALFRVLLGDIQYDEMHAVDRTITPPFFSSFVIVVWLMLMNIIVAIFNDTLHTIQEETQARGFNYGELAKNWGSYFKNCMIFLAGFVTGKRAWATRPMLLLYELETNPVEQLQLTLQGNIHTFFRMKTFLVAAKKVEERATEGVVRTSVVDLEGFGFSAKSLATIGRFIEMEAQQTLQQRKDVHMK